MSSTSFLAKLTIATLLVVYLFAAGTSSQVLANGNHLLDILDFIQSVLFLIVIFMCMKVMQWILCLFLVVEATQGRDFQGKKEFYERTKNFH